MFFSHTTDDTRSPLFYLFLEIATFIVVGYIVLMFDSSHPMTQFEKNELHLTLPSAYVLGCADVTYLGPRLATQTDAWVCQPFR